MRFHESTRVQLLQAARARYQGASGLDAVKLGGFLADATVAELQTAFGVTAGQATALKARLANQKSALATLRAAAGE